MRQGGLALWRAVMRSWSGCEKLSGISFYHHSGISFHHHCCARRNIEIMPDCGNPECGRHSPATAVLDYHRTTLSSCFHGETRAKRTKSADMNA
jgi:hypothetical protein